MTAVPHHQPPPIRIEFQRGNAKGLLLALPLTGFFATVLVLGAIWPQKVLSSVDPTTGRWISGCFGCFFSAIFLGALAGLPLMLRRHGVDFDQQGITWWDRRHRMLLPWHEIAAVGVGYMISPAPNQIIRSKEGQALEIYSAGYPFEERYLQFKFFRITEPPPRQGLPDHRYRILLPPLDGAAQKVETAVRTYAPHLWLGHYQRKWHRTPGR